MQKLKQLPERTLLNLFYFFFSGAFIVAAFFMPDRGNMFTGLWKIICNPTMGSTNFFDIGGYAATFLNMGLVGMICAVLCSLPKEKPNHGGILPLILTVGFGSWGIHILNVWPTIAGVVLYCLVKKEQLSQHVNVMVLTTGLAPFISEILVRYPGPEVAGLSALRILLAFVVGIPAGFAIPAGLKFAPKVHSGLTIYSAALPVGMAAFLMQGVLYKSMGIKTPSAVSSLAVADPVIVNSFCCILFGILILAALFLGCRPKDYWKLLTDPEVVTNFSATYGHPVMLMNTGIFGLFILAYYNLIGAQFNGVTFGVIFCMLCTCNGGSHPANVWPIMLGYGAISGIFQLISPVLGGAFAQQINAQAIVVGLCFANGLSLISDKYGWFWGMVAAMVHFCMVTTTPLLHGSMCLYNGGLTTGFVCLLMIPTLERIAPTKLERLARRAEKKALKAQ